MSSATPTKRKLEVDEQPSSEKIEPPAKRQRVVGVPIPADATKPDASSFSDPLTRENDSGFALPDTDSFINFSKYQDQCVEELEVSGCVHKVTYPPLSETALQEMQSDFHKPLPAYTPARDFKYELDVFQSRSCECVERNHNVLVAAHTSAGKTTVAEYAIAKALKSNQRVIYTSPIKALSNQKYRQLSEHFFDVGLMTGDVTINRQAGCIVMTTEILRNMLYRGAEIIREISWVIFDEIHYMKDPTRGVVWEETLILLPPQSRFVFLSATIPNSVEFAKWISKINGHPTHVIYTEFRPVPLQHYMFPTGGDGIHLVVDYKGNFKEQNFQKALNKMKVNEDGGSNLKGGASKSLKKRMKGKKLTTDQMRKEDIFKLVRMVMEREFDPCIVFAFSKRDVEELAMNLKKLDFCDDDEKKMISRIFNNAMSTLSDEDKRLPQLTSLVDLLQRGIGIHHAGLLPILKEVVEILFGEGLIKVLFATETFAMGVNFPAKTCIFSNVRKWDGIRRRLLTSGEYVQMSGRAGRRGLDQRGIVIMMVDDKLEPFEVQKMLKGQSDRLISQFHLTYPMLIQLMRVEDVDPTFLIQRSFMHFQTLEKTPQLRQRAEKLEAEQKSIELEMGDERSIAEYYSLRQALAELSDEYRTFQNKPEHILQWLNPGRLAHISQPKLNRDWGWGIVINFKKLSQKELTALQKAHGDDELKIDYIVDVLLPCRRIKVASDDESQSKQTTFVPINDDTKSDTASANEPKSNPEYRIIPVQLHHIERLSPIRVNMIGNIHLSEQRRKLGERLRQSLDRAKSANNGEIYLLDPIEDMKITDSQFKKLIRKIETLEDKMKAHSVHNSPELQILFEKYQRKVALGVELSAVKSEIYSLENNEHIQKKLKGMNRVLRRLQMIDKGIVTLKGRIACEISCGDELLATELLFSNLFAEMTSLAHVNALLSCFVFDEQGKDNTQGQLADTLQENYGKLKEKIRMIGEICEESKLEINVKKYLEQFGTGLMEVCYAWSEGAKFGEVMKMTDIYEGSIVRCIRRLHELLDELIRSTKIIGNEKLHQLFVDSQKAVRRDIIFAASLYL